MGTSLLSFLGVAGAIPPFSRSTQETKTVENRRSEEVMTRLANDEWFVLSCDSSQFFILLLYTISIQVWVGTTLSTLVRET
jgi:hypothetical protein